VHRIEAPQIYTTCSGRVTSHYPEAVVAQAYEPGGRTVEAVSPHGGYGLLTIPASYFHETATTKAGRRRITGYYVTGTLDDRPGTGIRTASPGASGCSSPVRWGSETVHPARGKADAAPVMPGP